MRPWPSGILIGQISIEVGSDFNAKSDPTPKFEATCSKGLQSIFNYSARNGALSKFHF